MADASITVDVTDQSEVHSLLESMPAVDPFDIKAALSEVRIMAMTWVWTKNGHDTMRPGREQWALELTGKFLQEMFDAEARACYEARAAS